MDIALYAMEVIDRVHQMAGKGFVSAEEIDFYDGNSNKNEDSNEDEDFNEDSNEKEQQVFDIEPNSERYIDDEETENDPGWLSELPREAEAGPVPDTKANSEGLTSHAPIEETDIEETEENPQTTGTIGETTIKTQVENIYFETRDLALTKGIHRNSRYNQEGRGITHIFSCYLMYLMAAGSVDSSAGLIGGDIVSTCTTWCCGVLWFVYTVIVLYAECPGYFPFDHVSSSDTFNSDVSWLHVSGKIPFALFYASNQCACCDWIPFFLPHVIHLTLHGQDFILVLCWHLPFYISN